MRAREGTVEWSQSARPSCRAARRTCEAARRRGAGSRAERAGGAHPLAITLSAASKAVSCSSVRGFWCRQAKSTNTPTTCAPSGPRRKASSAPSVAPSGSGCTHERQPCVPKHTRRPAARSAAAAAAGGRRSAGPPQTMLPSVQLGDKLNCAGEVPELTVPALNPRLPPRPPAAVAGELSSAEPVRTSSRSVSSTQRRSLRQQARAPTASMKLSTGSAAAARARMPAAIAAPVSMLSSAKDMTPSAKSKATSTKPETTSTPMRTRCDAAAFGPRSVP